jgi:hypothetical protein
VVRDSGDALVTSQPVGMQISILQTTATGTAVYVETQTPTTNVNGLVSLEIGTGSVVSGDFTTIDWSTDSYFIKTETDPAGGTTYTITGTSQLMSVPFALYAKTSGNGAGPIGPQGPAGNDGATGPIGADGAAGTNGTDGAQGIQGAQGDIGAAGADGAQGIQGADGASGQQGLAGNDGATGLTGPVGPTGSAGSLGPQGIQGAAGTPGIQGASGADGAAGAPGAPGVDGAAGTNGTNGTQGNQGATGTSGADGAAGAAGAAGTNGTDGTPGIQGATGADGATGPSGTNGTQGIQGPSGTNGTQGIQGATGPSGADGSTGIPTGGTEGQVLKIVGGIPTWVDPAVIGQTFYEDTDNDGYGDINSTIVASAAPNGYVSDNADCNDTDAAINPATVWFIGVDTDGDTFFGSTTSLTQCESPGTGYVIAVPATLDCDDSLATGSSINPDAIEVPANGIDDNCDGQVDEATVGELREGGIVFWVDPADNTHGKVCALSDYLTVVEWVGPIYFGLDLINVPNVTSFPPAGSGAEIGDGESNTNWILDDCPIAYAALAARSLGPEWFLPSAKELNEMYIHKTTLEAVSGVSALSNFYWSSTEYDHYNAWGQYFGNGNQFYYNKTNAGHVRAVRAF